jgi:N-acetylglucosaminyl-diphospho-decaprenol L-rhamnosyltransferase
LSAAVPTGALDVAIVSFRCEGLLRDCLASLREHPGARSPNVHVVDNASGDGTAEMVRREFGEVELTVLGRNAGFSAANNIAIRAGSAPLVLVLNPDTRVTAGALDRLCDVIDARPEVGIAGPRLERPDGSFDHAARRSFPTPLSALGHFTGIGRRRTSGALAAYRAPEVESGPVDAVNGACMLIRRSAIDAAGDFDEAYWMYMEDLDLCYRFAAAGWVTWYEPRAVVVHVKAGTSGPIRTPRLDYSFHWGMYRFYRDHYAPQRNPLVNGAIYAGIVARLAISEARGLAARARRSPAAR